MNTIQKTFLFFSFFSNIILTNNKELSSKVDVLMKEYRNICNNQTVQNQSKQTKIEQLYDLKNQSEILFETEIQVIESVFKLTCYTILTRSLSPKSDKTKNDDDNRVLSPILSLIGLYLMFTESNTLIEKYYIINRLKRFINTIDVKIASLSNT